MRSGEDRKLRPRGLLCWPKLFPGTGLLLTTLVAAAGCSSPSLTPDTSDVKASREAPSDKCVEVSKVTGSTMTAQGTPEEALKDLKKDAANRGANYVRIDEYSTYGTAVSGVAYKCP